MGISSKLSSGGRLVLPRTVREHLGIGPGDMVEYELCRGYVLMRSRQRPISESNPFAIFNEWADTADAEDYADL